MADQPQSRRRPRVRKSAPTIRERVEAAQAEAENGQPKKGRRLTAKAAAPLKKLRLGQRRPVKAASKPLGYLKRALIWIIPSYFVNSWKELRLVQWTSRRETWRLTLAVFIFAVVFGALVAGVDKSLDELFKKVVLK